MAVPKTTETRWGVAVTRQNRTYKDCTSNPIPASFFKVYSPFQSSYTYHSLQKSSMDKNGCRDEVTCVVFVCPVLPGHCHVFHTCLHRRRKHVGSAGFRPQTLTVMGTLPPQASGNQRSDAVTPPSFR